MQEHCVCRPSNGGNRNNPDRFQQYSARVYDAATVVRQVVYPENLKRTALAHDRFTTTLERRHDAGNPAR